MKLSWTKRDLVILHLGDGTFAVFHRKAGLLPGHGALPTREAADKAVDALMAKHGSAAFIGDTYRAKSGAFTAILVAADGAVRTMRRCDDSREFRITAGELAACYEK